MSKTKSSGLLSLIAEHQDVSHYQNLLWEGSFGDYLDIVRERPEVTRNAWQRLYDMILSYGSTAVEDDRDNLVRYHFFDDPDENGASAIFGLTRPLMERQA